ncbi:MAG: sugar ABC transporter substrate-binding protein [Gammaproteobacteria bacterium]|nr:sugar ABC transporter substrate-binding protein [Gammaproteobacteria bacterium]
MFKNTSKAVAITILMLMVVLSLAACGRSNQSPQPQSQEKETASTSAPSDSQSDTTKDQAQSTDDSFNPYAPYAGETIVVSWPSLSHFEKAKTLISEFEKETGIKVEVDSIQYMNMKDKQVLEMSKPMGQGGYDVVSWVIFNKTEYVNKGYLTELAPFFTNARLADPDYDPEDIVPAYLKSGNAVGGRRGYLSGPTDAIYGIPFGAETSIMAYRKDIFEEYGLKVPTTYDELLEVASFITEDVDGVYGMTSRGSSNHHIVHAWLLHASPYGASIFDDKWNVTVDSPQAKAATETLKAIIDNSPPGVTSWGFGEEANAFLQGESAIFIDTLKIAAMSRDPEQSLVDGKVGFALHPTGPAGCGSETGGFTMGIPNNSAHKEAAFLFIQWMTSKRGDRMIVEAGGDPIRISTMSDPELQAQFPEYPVILEQLKCANEDWRPLIPEWGEINAPIMGINLGEYVNGQTDLDTALSNAKMQIQDVMERAGYYTWANYSPPQ